MSIPQNNITAVPYVKGMEDGYFCYELNGKFIGYYKKNSPLPKVNRVPVIETTNGCIEPKEGQWIVTSDKGKIVCDPQYLIAFEEKYICYSDDNIGSTSQGNNLVELCKLEGLISCAIEMVVNEDLLGGRDSEASLCLNRVFDFINIMKRKGK